MHPWRCLLVEVSRIVRNPSKAEPRIAIDQGIDKGAGFPDATKASLA
jgi:hypothetical protein